MTAVRPEPAGRDGGFEPQFERVVAALGRRTPVASFGFASRGVGLVAAGPYGRFDGFKVSLGLGVKQPGQPRHAVGPLRAQVQPPAPGAILVVEEAVRIEMVGNPPAEPGHDAGVEFGRVPHQGDLGVRRVRERHAGGQNIHRRAYRPDVVLAHRTVGHRGRQCR